MNADIAAFERELETLINKHSRENGSNTPDFILARYLVGCLITFDAAVSRREAWYGREPTPAPATIAAQLNRPPSPDDPTVPPKPCGCPDDGAICLHGTPALLMDVAPTTRNEYLGISRDLLPAPIPLTPAQEAAVTEWAADDRLWTTRETVEFNLRTFARVILKPAAVDPSAPPAGTPSTRAKDPS